tara:strand:- start:5584 stop:6144 length:561 start_codon:yes stop_codon:yes gene_type:complete
MKDVYYWWKVFETTEIKDFNKECKKYFQKGIDRKAVGVTKTANVFYINKNKFLQSKYKDKLYRIFQMVDEANRKVFGFNIYGNPHMYDGVFNYNVYNAEREGTYDWHIDGNLVEQSDLKLTALINLSEQSYKGGELKIVGRTHYEVPEMKPGYMIVFPSFLAHKVEPVTEGERISLAMWFWGPPFV